MYVYPYGDSQQLNLDWIINKLKEASAANLEEIANVFIALTHNSGTQYRRYDYCYYQDKLYRALNDNIGPFNASDWMEVRLGDDIPVLTRLINAIDAAAVFDVKFDTTGTNGKLQQKYNDTYHDVVEVDYTPVQNSKRPLSSNAGYDLNTALEAVFDAGINSHDDCNNFVEGLVKYDPDTLNIPESGWGIVIGYVADSQNWKWQIAITTNHPIPNIFKRDNINNGGWDPWKRIADEDDISVLNTAITQVEGQISAYLQTSTIASRTYYKGEYLIYNGVLYHVDDTIASGTSISSKITAKTVGAELYDLLNKESNGTITKADGRTGTLDFTTCKKKGNFVQVSGRVHTMSNEEAMGAFMMIPEGFRPTQNIFVNGYMVITGVGNISILTEIRTDGSVRFGYSSNDTTTQVGFAGFYQI